jgi:hypothetical protein
MCDDDDGPACLLGLVLGKERSKDATRGLCTPNYWPFCCSPLCLFMCVWQGDGLGKNRKRVRIAHKQAGRE